MPKKKPAKFKPKSNRFVAIQCLNDEAEKQEKYGAHSQKEGYAHTMMGHFDNARCLRTAANWLEANP